MGAKYRATAHVGPFNKDDIVSLDPLVPSEAGLIATGWFEQVGFESAAEILGTVVDNSTPPWNLGSGHKRDKTLVEHVDQLPEVHAVAPVEPLDLSGHTGPIRQEYLDLFSQPDIRIFKEGSSGGGQEDPGGAGPDLRAQRRRQSRRALRRGDDQAGTEPGAGAVPEGHEQPGE